MKIIIFILLFVFSFSFSQTEEIIRSGNSNLHYKTFGTGKPILIINGGPGMNCEGFSYLAKELAIELNYQNAHFIHSDIYDLPNHLKGQFDVVFTSYGTVGWLPDINKWAKIIAYYLKPNGVFYIADFHPFVWTLSNDFSKIEYNYFGGEAIVEIEEGTYADRNAPIKNTSVSWNHSLSSIINALINNDLRIEFVNEFPYSPYNCFQNTVLGDDGFYRIKGIENLIPMVYSIKAINTKKNINY